MREKVGSLRSLGDIEVKKFFRNWREKAAPWKELVTTAEAYRNRPRNSRGPASKTISEAPSIFRRAPASWTMGQPVRRDRARA